MWPQIQWSNDGLLVIAASMLAIAGLAVLIIVALSYTRTNPLAADLVWLADWVQGVYRTRIRPAVFRAQLAFIRYADLAADTLADAAVRVAERAKPLPRPRDARPQPIADPDARRRPAQEPAPRKG